MKLITIISVLLPLLMLCPIGSIALRCHFCLGAAADKTSDCPEGQSTEEKECIGASSSSSSDLQWRCSIQSKNKKRISLGCSLYKGRILDGNSIECSSTFKDVGVAALKVFFSCSCVTDSCNIYDSNSLKCLSCQTEDDLPTGTINGRSYYNKCENGQNPFEERCLLGTKYCVYRNNTKYVKYDNKVVRNTEIYKGCSTESPDNSNYKETGNGYSCKESYQVSPVGATSADRECYCKSSLCNTYLNKYDPPPTPPTTTPSPVLNSRGSENHPSSSLTLFIIISTSVTASLQLFNM